MKEIRLKTMQMHYFKGTKDRTVTFGGKETCIEAPNAAGKSTIVDAFFWCMWGKNANGEQKFSVKTLDMDGVEIPHVDHEVIVTLTVDGEPQTFRRVFVPEYDKDDELKGNHTDYYWNDVPMKKVEYDAKVSAIIGENTFKYITSPYFFLSQDWKKQRETLMRMAGNVTDDDVSKANDGRFDRLVEVLKGKSLDEYQKEITAKLRKVGEAMVGIPARIDEVKRGIPEEPDVKALEQERDAMEATLREMDKEAMDIVAAVNARNADRNLLAKKISDLEFRQRQILDEAQAADRNRKHEANRTWTLAENDRKAVRMEEESDAADLRQKEAHYSGIIGAADKAKTAIAADMQQLREDWAKENARKFSAEDYLKCPLYGHVCQDGEACAKYDGEQGKALDIFIKGKAERLAAINERGKALKAELSAKDTAISEAQAKVTEVRNAYVERKAKRDAKLSELDVIQHNSPKQPLTSDIKGTDLPEWVEIGLEIEQKKSLLASMTEHKADFTDGNEGKREAIKARIKAISVELSAVDRIREADKRVYELESELSEYGGQKTLLEAERELCKEFEIAKMEMITDKVNGRFRIVRWQMFERQVNGEEVPACICLCGGTPWSDANACAKVNAGIDVAHTLGEASGISAPMFIDGAESFGNIYNPGGQRILLRFSRDVREMTITNE